MKEVCEYQAIEVFIEAKNSILIVSLYRPPNTDLKIFNSKLNDFLEVITQDKKTKIFIAADTNTNLMKSKQCPDSCIYYHLDFFPQ